MKLEKTTERIRSYYDNPTLIEMGDQVAESVSTIEELEAEVKRIKKNFTTDIDGHKAKVRDMSQKIRQGYSYEQVNCVLVRDFHEKEVHTIRMDTCELVSTRSMQPHEQMPLAEADVYGVRSIEDVKKLHKNLKPGCAEDVKIASSFFAGKWKEATAFVTWIKKIKGTTVVSNDDEAITILTLKNWTPAPAKKKDDSKVVDIDSKKKKGS